MTSTQDKHWHRKRSYALTLLSLATKPKTRETRFPGLWAMLTGV